MMDIKMLGILGLLTPGSGFFKIPSPGYIFRSAQLFSVPVPAHRRVQNLFTLWCQHSIDTVTSAVFSGLICVNYHVCNHRESNYILKQVQSDFQLSRREIFLSRLGLKGKGPTWFSGKMSWGPAELLRTHHSRQLGEKEKHQLKSQVWDGDY